MNKKCKNHKTGYYVWIFGDCYWHRTKHGARKRSLDAINYCNGQDNQIIDCKTNEEIKENK